MADPKLKLELDGLRSVVHAAGVTQKPARKTRLSGQPHVLRLRSDIKKGRPQSLLEVKAEHKKAHAAVRQQAEEAFKKLDQGKYSEAAQSLDRLLTDRHVVGTNEGYQDKASGAELLAGTDALRRKGAIGQDDTAVKQLKTVRDQSRFLSDMQTAGIEPSAPPTEAELKKYFGTLKGKTQEAAKAYSKYAKAFHVNVHDEVYSADSRKIFKRGKYYDNESQLRSTKGAVASVTAAPDDFKELTSKARDRFGANSEHYGKMNNDCEGHAKLGQILLEAAGMKVESFLVSAPQIDRQNRRTSAQGHAMVVMAAQDGTRVVVSNEDAVVAKNAKKAARQAALTVYSAQELKGASFFFGETLQDASFKMSADLKKYRTRL